MGRKNRNPLTDRLAYGAQRAFLGLTGALPYRQRLAIAGRVGRMAVTRIPKFHDRIAANLAHVMPELDRAARDRIAGQTGDSFGRTLIEILHNPDFHRQGTCIAPDGDAAQMILDAARDGTGALLVGGHFGQWEASRVWLKALGVNVGGIYRPTDNPLLNAYYHRNLEFGGKPVLPKGSRGFRGLVSHVAKGGIAGILVDQYEKRSERIDFLGQPAPTSFVAADLALKYNVPLIPVYGIREPDGVSVRIVVEPPVEVGTPREMMHRVNDSLAARIREHPGQYYWLHRRWEKKLPRPDS